MTSHDDGSGREESRGRPFRTPGIKSAVARRVRYKQPRTFFTAGKEHAETEVLEIDVETDAEFPMAGTGPALLVGGLALIDSERVGERRYRFFAPAATPLDKDASVALGRAGSGTPRPETKSRLRLEWGSDEDE